MTDFDTTTQNETASTAEDYPNTFSSARSGDFTKDARTEASGMLRDGMKHPSTKPVLTGAAIGAAAGLVLPFVGPIFGAAVGGGYSFYRRLRPADAS